MMSKSGIFLKRIDQLFLVTIKLKAKMQMVNFGFIYSQQIGWHIGSTLLRNVGMSG